MIKKHDLETDINNLKNLINKGQNIGSKIIELINDNNDDIKTIHKYAECIIDKNLSSYTLSLSYSIFLITYQFFEIFVYWLGADVLTALKLKASEANSDALKYSYNHKF